MSRPVLIGCLEHALRCGPESDQRERWAQHGPAAGPVWTRAFYLRSVALLAGFQPEGTEVLTRSLAWPLPATAALARERALAQHPRVDPRPPPPAGLSPCPVLPRAADIADAVLTCFRTRVAPAILGLKSQRSDYRFGDPRYVQETYALPPVVTVDPRARPQLRQELQAIPSPLLLATTALGSLELVDPRRSWIVVTVLLTSPDLPTDGGTRLEFIVDAETWTTVLVYRVLHG